MLLNRLYSVTDTDAWVVVVVILMTVQLGEWTAREAVVDGCGQPSVPFQTRGHRYAPFSVKLFI